MEAKFEPDFLDVVEVREEKSPQRGKADEEWETCCSKSETSFIKYMVQAVLAGMIIIFSMVQLMTGAKNESLYFSLISIILGLFFPHPTIIQKSPAGSRKSSPSRPSSRSFVQSPPRSRVQSPVRSPPVRLKYSLSSRALS